MISVLGEGTVTERKTTGRGEIAILVWRDTTHPEGGGSEVYVEHMARRNQGLRRSRP